jgi:hypothetical protein
LSAACGNDRPLSAHLFATFDCLGPAALELNNLAAALWREALDAGRHDGGVDPGRDQV